MANRYFQLEIFEFFDSVLRSTTNSVPVSGWVKIHRKNKNVSLRSSELKISAVLLVIIILHGSKDIEKCVLNSLFSIKIWASLKYLNQSLDEDLISDTFLFNIIPVPCNAYYMGAFGTKRK